MAFTCLQLLLSGGALLRFQDSLARRSAASASGHQGFPGLPFGSTLSLSVSSCLLPGLMQYSLSLLDACWPPHSAHSLPSSTVTSNLFSITHPARSGPAAQRWPGCWTLLPSPGLSSVLGGVDLLDSKINGSVAPLGPRPWRFLQTTSLAPYPPCRHCHHFLLSPSHEGVAVLPTSSPSGDHLFYGEGTGFHAYCWLCYLYQVTCRWDLIFSGERPSLLSLYYH